MVHLKEIDTQRFIKGLKEEPQRSKDKFLSLGFFVSGCHYLFYLLFKYYLCEDWMTVFYTRSDKFKSDITILFYFSKKIIL